MATLFIRNPKTAGSTISTRLKALGAWEAGYGSSFDVTAVQERLDAGEHCMVLPGGGKWRLVRRLGMRRLREHHIVSAMRNPYARVISGWAHCVKKGWLPEDSTPMQALRVSPNQQPHIWHHVGWQQTSVLYDGGRPFPDRVLAFEWLQHDFDQLCEHLGYPQKQLAVLNASPHRPWRDYYEQYPRLRRLVEVRLANDIRRLPYQFELDGPTGRFPGDKTECPRDCT